MKTAVITGAGSGVGSATALKLAAAGWRVALLGRRLETLQATAVSCANGSQVSIHVCDISKQAEVETVARKILEQFAAVDALINAAGTNAPRRSLELLSLHDYHQLMDTNLNGAYYCVQAFLPGMRARKSGTIVNIVSDAAKQASAKAGPAYVMSKFGLLGLTQAINAEEKGNGVRACAILPGDIDTPLLDKRPSPPPAEARANMLQAEDIAECVFMVLTLPSRAIVEELLIRPR
ncbi:MAG: SDR family NAD(P)-dependent oxidoreductase [Verrucomicrobiota bacterium]|nr:SDR family NAD(P)-dependent oxidoreductase [Verrucomicrobiota bacterium]